MAYKHDLYLHVETEEVEVKSEKKKKKKKRESEAGDDVAENSVVENAGKRIEWPI